MLTDPSLGWRWFEAIVGLGTLLFIMFCVYVLAVPEAFSGGDDGDDDTDPDATPLVPPPHGTRRDAADVPPVADVRPVPRLRIRIVGRDRRGAYAVPTATGIPRDVSLGVDYVRKERAARIVADQRAWREEENRYRVNLYIPDDSPNWPIHPVDLPSDRLLRHDEAKRLAAVIAISSRRPA